MRTVDIHEAKAHLSRLVERAAKGESFVIAKAGKPLVKVVPLDAPAAVQVRRLGFMAGQIAVPDHFDRMGSAKIARLLALRGREGLVRLFAVESARDRLQRQRRVGDTQRSRASARSRFQASAAAIDNAGAAPMRRSRSVSLARSRESAPGANRRCRIVAKDAG